MSPSRESCAPVHYAIAGFGRFAHHRLLPAFQECRNSRLSAVWKRTPFESTADPSLLEITKSSNNLRIHASYDDLLADPDIEAIYITSANADHVHQAIAAASAKKHVLCEKPLATTPSGCRRIITACRKNHVLLMVAQTLRFSPAVRQIAAWISAGKLGKIVQGSAQFCYDGTKSPRSWLYDYRVAGGGVLLDIGVHCIDTLRFLFGDIAVADGFLTFDSRCKRIEVAAELNLRFASDVLGHVSCSYCSPYHSRLEVAGELGRAWVEPFTLPWADVKAHLESVHETTELTVNTNNPYALLLDSFSRAILGQEPVAIPGEEGLAAVSLITKIYDQFHQES
jgi:predicted dehydrogenase